MKDEKIAVHDKFKAVLSRLEFRAYRKAIILNDGLVGVFLGNMSLQKIANMMGTWNADSMVEGLNYLSERCKSETVFHDIWSEDDVRIEPSRENTALVAYPQKTKSKFVLICTGGGYASVASIAEAFPVAKRVNELGYAAFVLKYRAGKHALAPNPMEDIAQAVRYILLHAEEFNIDTKDYAVAGFSAGGHLSASFGTESIGYKHYGLPRPGAIILAYPVITMLEKTHPGSRKRLLGKRNLHYQEMLDKYSIEQQITSDYPPAFVWQCEQDNTVPIENTQMLVKKFREKGINHIYETFPGNAHGWGEGKGTAAEGWINCAIDFWEKSC